MKPSNPTPLNRFRQDIQGMHAYAVQDSQGLIKLDAMENPYPLAAALKAELAQRLSEAALNRYPSTEPQALREALARYAALPASCSLILGNGSDELISLLAMACDVPGAAILAPEPGFVMYAMSAKLQGLRYIGVPLKAQDFSLDRPAMLAAIEHHSPALTYIAYPNNPTANAFAAADVDELIAACARAGSIVVLDEAYQPFARDSYATRLGKPGFEHMLVMRTMSKFGLAGVRIGYLMGASALIEQIDKARPPYNISNLNAVCALFALEHESEFASQAALIKAERARLLQAFATFAGTHAFPSDANMILLRVPDADASFAALKSEGILVKNASKMHPLLHNCLRITVGTSVENDALLAALAKSL